MRATKRVFDIVAAAVILIVLAPVFLLTAVAILLDSGRPIWFRQTRAGLDGAPYQLLKFRSMVSNSIAPEDIGQVGNDHAMVTRVGQVLRRYKVDEVPQLINVLRGEMSLVGPRPMLPSMASELSERERIRFRVRPGMTGWAQVNGNVELSWKERILLDIWYVEHRNTILDFRILMRTFFVIVCGERRSKSAFDLANQ